MEPIQDTTSPAEPWHLTALILSKTSVAQGPSKEYTAGFLTSWQSVFFMWSVPKENVTFSSLGMETCRFLLSIVVV